MESLDIVIGTYLILIFYFKCFPFLIPHKWGLMSASTGVVRMVTGIPSDLKAALKPSKM
jgi:hypothetical protein